MFNRSSMQLLRNHGTLCCAYLRAEDCYDVGIGILGRDPRGFATRLTLEVRQHAFEFANAALENSGHAMLCMLAGQCLLQGIVRRSWP